MPRYFIEVSYKGTAYAGFQIQKNSNTIQAEVEKALKTLFKQAFSLTGASRTDAGVHALQNYFHFDTVQLLTVNKNGKKRQDSKVHSHEIPTEIEEAVYNLNAILPRDIVIKRIYPVADDAHCRFDAVSREYKYFIYQNKNPFLEGRAYYFPYKLQLETLNKAAAIILQYQDFTSFSKKNTQVNNFICKMIISEWIIENNVLVYNVKANRFLRGMVKGMVATMLKVGTGKISLEEFDNILKSRDCSKADFSAPSHGLFLVGVEYKNGLFMNTNN